MRCVFVCRSGAYGYCLFDYPVTYAVEGRQYLAVPVGGGTLANISTYTPELEAPSGRIMIVTFVLPE